MVTGSQSRGAKKGPALVETCPDVTGEERFWTAFGSLLRQASSLEDESRAEMLSFLLSGPGSDLLDKELTGDVTIRQGLEIICGQASVIDTMKRLNALPANLAAGSDDPPALFARLILEKVAPAHCSSPAD